MSALLAALPFLRGVIVDAQKTWFYYSEDVESLGMRARNAIDDLEQLAEASQRTVDAFIAASKASGMDFARAHLVCEAAMLEQAAALRRVRGEQ